MTEFTIEQSNLPTVSVIIPTYHRNEYLIDAIESAQKQQYPNIEIIVVDDSGLGNAESCVEQFDDIEYIKLESNHGANVARNIGYLNSTGNYIQFLDDDDVIKPNKILKQVRRIENSESISVVYSGVELQSGEVHYPKKNNRGRVLRSALTFDMWPCMTSTMLIDDSVLEQITPLEHSVGADDLKMMINLAQITNFEYVDEALVIKRSLDNSRGNSKGAVQGRERIIYQFRDVYSQFPADVRDTAMYETYKRKGEYYIENNHWSLIAILSFIKSAYYSPNKRIRLLIRIMISVFGRPGWVLARLIHNRINF